MAVIKSMVAEHIISGFKGKLDFYYYMGLACVRRWPKSPGKIRSDLVMSTWSAFSYASQEWSNLSPEIQRTYEELATGSGLTARDMFMRAYLTGLYRNPTP